MAVEDQLPGSVATEPPDIRLRGLVYHAGALGDFVLSLPAIYRVVQAFPGLSWHLWSDADRRALVPGFQPAPPALLREGHTLWGESPSPEASSVLQGFQAVLAFGGKRPPAWAVPPGPQLVRVASFPPFGDRRVPRYQASQLDEQGVPGFTGPWLPRWRAEVLAQRSLEDIVLHPGSGDAGKNAPVALWAGALAELRRVVGSRQRLVLGPVEAERGGWRELAADVDDVAVCRSIPDLLQVLAKATLFLGNDSGASHLAGVLGVPSLVLFGPSNSHVWRPLGPCVRVLDVKERGVAAASGKRASWRRAEAWSSIDPGEVVRQALNLVSLPLPANGRATRI